MAQNASWRLVDRPRWRKTLTARLDAGRAIGARRSNSRAAKRNREKRQVGKSMIDSYMHGELVRLVREERMAEASCRRVIAGYPPTVPWPLATIAGLSQRI